LVKERRIAHITDGPQPRDLFSDLPRHRCSVVPLTIGLVIKLSPQVREGFVDGAGLVKIKQVGLMLCDSMCQLMSDTSSASEP
jgi:hypothetical protein